MVPHAKDDSAIASKYAGVGNLPVTSGFKFEPKYRNGLLTNPELWIKGKVEVDDVYPYWRVHDKLYDLKTLIEKHPGGKFWIEATQGMDITESYESFHSGNTPDEWLAKFFVKDASTPRNSPFTFKQDGFYMTLKRKAIPILNKHGRGPTWEMILIQDGLFFGFLCFFLLTAWYNSIYFAIVGGIFSSFAAITSHNFSHQKDNWRMYIFDVTSMSSREWRISHVISHHLFPNTIYDYEVAATEPIIEFLPRNQKSFMSRYFNIPSFYLLCAFGFFIGFLSRLVLIFQGKVKIRVEGLLPIIQILIMISVAESASSGLWLWIVLQTCSNLIFLSIGLTSAHHHTEIYHEGDEAFLDKDWGLHQIAATRDRKEITSNLFFATITFSFHTLHHLFPTVDLSKLHLLMPVLLETCKEFGVKMELYTMTELIKGTFTQMSNVFPNTMPSKCFKSSHN